MTTLDERFQASHPVLARLGRADANGIPLGNAMMQEIAPDQWRIIQEACFGVLWTRPALSMEQRSLATISIITVLRRDDNLKGHIHSGLDVGLTSEQIVEVMLQLIFYTGAPIANTALLSPSGSCSKTRRRTKLWKCKAARCAGIARTEMRSIVRP